MNILFITEIAPFPPNTGERIRSYNLINSLLEFTDRLFLIADNAPPEKEKYKKVEFEQFPGIYTKSRWKNLFVLVRRNRKFVNAIMKIVDNQKIDIAFLDYHYIGNYIGIFKKKGIKVIYGTHNVQSKLHFQIPPDNLKDFIYRRIGFLMEVIHEQVYFRQADTIIGVSDEDLIYYKKYYKRSNLCLIPNYINEKEYEEDHVEVKKKQVIMSGTFLAFQNITGLRWFLENVWDDELASLANLIVVGHGSTKHFDIIKKDNPSLKNAEALGSVDNMKSYIAESKVAIIPLLHGSGTRLKCIEAMALKTNIIGTSLGVEGIRHNGSILIADSASDFKNRLISVLKDEIHNEEKAFTVFMDTYSSSSNTPRLKEIVEKTCRGEATGD